MSQITQAYGLCYGRVPKESEVQVAQAFLAQQTEKYKGGLARESRERCFGGFVSGTAGVE